jgi:hypothetical protein
MFMYLAFQVNLVLWPTTNCQVNIMNGWNNSGYAKRVRKPTPKPGNASTGKHQDETSEE